MVCGPGRTDFEQRNNKLVWDETVRIVLDMFDNVWKRADVISVDHVVDITLPVFIYLAFPYPDLTQVVRADCAFRYWCGR